MLEEEGGAAGAGSRRFGKVCDVMDLDVGGPVDSFAEPVGVGAVEPMAVDVDVVELSEEEVEEIKKVQKPSAAAAVGIRKKPLKPLRLQQPMALQQRQKTKKLRPGKRERAQLRNNNPPSLSPPHSVSSAHLNTPPRAGLVQSQKPDGLTSGGGGCTPMSKPDGLASGGKGGADIPQNQARHLTNPVGIPTGGSSISLPKLQKSQNPAGLSTGGRGGGTRRGPPLVSCLVRGKAKALVVGKAKGKARVGGHPPQKAGGRASQRGGGRGRLGCHPPPHLGCPPRLRCRCQRDWWTPRAGESRSGFGTSSPRPPGW